MAFAINAGLNSNTGDLSTDGVFMYSYISATKTLEIKIKDSLNCEVKTPTDEELSNYVNGTWDSVSAPYDNRDPVNQLSVEQLCSNQQGIECIDFILSKFGSLPQGGAPLS